MEVDVNTANDGDEKLTTKFQNGATQDVAL